MKLTPEQEEILNDPTVSLARAIARSALAGQFRMDGVTPSFAHSEAVGLALVAHGPYAVAAGLLHDVPEDNSRFTSDSLFTMGIPAEVVHAVEVLTHRHGVPYEQYIGEIKKNPLARLVKIEDIKHNSAGTPTPRKRAMYAKALESLQSEDVPLDRPISSPANPVPRDGISK